MKNEKKIKNRIKLVILMPLFLGVVLLGLCIYKNGFETRMGLLSIGILVIYLLITFIMYFRTTPYIESVLVEYSLEQGKIQKELLHELEVPYAILDLSGHIMWANNMFHDTIGVAHNKRIRKSVDAYFPEIVPELIDGSDSIEISIEHDNRMYKVSIKRIDMSKVFDEDREETKDDDIVLAMYLFDETELRRLEQESVDQKLYAGLLYLDN
jgi:c-di-AMP phosphodiesterase-like protein